MIKVAIVGKGTVSKHLSTAFAGTDNVTVVQVLPSRANELSYALADLSTKNLPDIYIIAVSDDAIATVSQQLSTSDKLVVHTSGSVGMNSLPTQIRKGVFYPLQTFSKQKEVNFKGIPICIEASRKEDVEMLQKIATALSDSVYKISSDQRKSLHLAAVFINNFSNHMYQIGNEICEENALPFSILKPLIKETAAKIDALDPKQAQTGPAKRNDQQTIAKQLKQLENKSYKKVYEVLTESIIQTHGKKL